MNEKESELIGQDFESQVLPEKTGDELALSMETAALKKGPIKLNPKNKLLVILGAISLILILMLLLVSIKRSPEKKNIPASATPSLTKPTSLPSQGPGNIIIDPIESEVKNIEKMLNDVDLKESKLTPPTLDMKIKFEKNP